MDFTFTPEQEALQRNVREFARRELAPMDEYLEDTMEFPWEAIGKMADLGITGVLIPPEYGGSQLDAVSYALVAYEMGYAGGPGYLLAGITLGSLPIVMSGSEPQKQKYLPPVAQGIGLCSFGLTEPDAGSDNLAMRSTAVEVEGGYVLNGQKRFISLAGEASTYIVFAKTDKKVGAKGVTAFIVEKGAPGFSFGPQENKMGLKWVPLCDLILEDVFVPRENVLGEVGGGFKVAMSVLDYGRITVAAGNLGIAQHAFDLAARYSLERVQFGKPIASFQATQFKLAELATQLEAGRLLAFQAAWRKERGIPVTLAASYAKLFVTDLAIKVTYEAQQIHGGYGYIKEYKVEGLARVARLGTIGEGTSEIQKILIAQNLLKLYQ
ncbi:MAG: acyl-CoA dehydrogenase [Firmicutes bacterium]|nr:acyl-CoA dehydrogenase [Bacillota bacterium]